jgi:hypothetical protein
MVAEVRKSRSVICGAKAYQTLIAVSVQRGISATAWTSVKLDDGRDGLRTGKMSIAFASWIPSHLGFRIQVSWVIGYCNSSHGRQKSLYCIPKAKAMT